ncbi:hypothetical protein ACFL2H_09180 [Planctomycetota bacterium]
MHLIVEREVATGTQSVTLSGTHSKGSEVSIARVSLIAERQPFTHLNSSSNSILRALRVLRVLRSILSRFHCFLAERIPSGVECHSAVC